jgi:hypothetical protein
MRGMDIIKEMLQPQKILKGSNENKQIVKNYKDREQTLEKYKKNKEGIPITNAPYKTIIKDKIITKKVDEVKIKDLIVHIPNKDDRDKIKFVKELKRKNEDKEKINDELNIEFHIERYDKHKKNFEYKESYIKNLAYEGNTFDESKQDYIDFYKKHQKQIEEGKEKCDDILFEIEKSGIINPEDLPIAVPETKSENKVETKVENKVKVEAKVEATAQPTVQPKLEPKVQTKKVIKIVKKVVAKKPLSVKAEIDDNDLLKELEETMELSKKLSKKLTGGTNSIKVN